MAAYNATFTGAIREAATAAGQAPTAEQVETLNAILQSLATVIDGRVVVEDGETTVAIDTYLRRQVASFPRAPQTDAQPAPASSATAGEPILSANGEHVFIKSTSGSRWARRDDPMTRIITGFEASEQAARVHEANRWPNPWCTGPNFNRTRQQIISNIDPARAAILRAEASA